MKIAITGISGFIGGWLSEYLINKHYVVRGIPSQVLKDFNTLKTSLVGVDVIIHLAGQSSPAYSWKDPYGTLKDNISTTLNVVRSCEELEIRGIIAGSSEIYEPIDTPISEDGVLNSRNPYGLSKLLNDSFIRMVAEERKINITILRMFNNIGPKQSDSFVVSTFAKQLADIKLGIMSNVVEVGNLESKRDFIDVRDSVRAFEAVLNLKEHGGCYNICSGNSYTIQWILDELIQISGLSVNVVVDKDRMRPSDIPIFLGSYDKLKKLTGWHPIVDIKSTLRDVYAYWLDRGVENAR